MVVENRTGLSTAQVFNDCEQLTLFQEHGAELLTAVDNRKGLSKTRVINGCEQLCTLYDASV